ncbi:MAG: DNA protecting protein DprA [Spirochaetes bacterium GWF1_51_8]|nr:MAG: DNA protecting protein DprA [Spirochaetes bacterium GWF1_51_8]
MNDALYHAALSSNDLIGPKRYGMILDEFGAVEPFFGLSPREQIELLGLKKEDAAVRLEGMLGNGEKIVRDCEKKGIAIITRGDPKFPPSLLTISDAPYILYMAGKMNYSIPLIGVVGTREPSNEAVNINRYFVTEFVNFQLGIVSGMARGHDTVAQETALENRGYTVAVLACGVDIVYPASNRALYRSIVEHGAVVSEYPPGVQPDKWRFPLRNRIISGLANIVFIVQAPVGSGALITANYAEAQNKDVYVVPGNPMDSRYAGSNQLLQRGAKVALNPEDIVLDLCGGKKTAVKRKVKEMPALDEAETKIYEQLAGERHIDELAALTGIPIAELNSTLTQLELKGIVIQYPGRFYIRNI